MPSEGLVMIGGTKQQELLRSAELYFEISKREGDGPTQALRFLLDCQYDRQEFKAVVEILEKKRGK